MLRIFDRDGKGYVGSVELLRGLQNLNSFVNEKDISRILNRYTNN